MTLRLAVALARQRPPSDGGAAPPGVEADTFGLAVLEDVFELLKRPDWRQRGDRALATRVV